MTTIRSEDDNATIDEALQIVLRITYEIARLQDIFADCGHLLTKDEQQEIKLRLDIAHRWSLAAQTVLAPF